MLVKYNNEFYFPIIESIILKLIYGGDFETEADYRDPYVQNLINNEGWIIWPIIPYSYNTIIRDLELPAPAPPSKKNWLGTDDQARDVLARLIYGFRISILFGFVLTFFSMIIGVSAGAIQGYFGGKIDLIFPAFYGSLVSYTNFICTDYSGKCCTTKFLVVVRIILLLFSWMGYVGVVRAEFLRAQKF